MGWRDWQLERQSMQAPKYWMAASWEQSPKKEFALVGLEFDPKLATAQARLWVVAASAAGMVSMVALPAKSWAVSRWLQSPGALQENRPELDCSEKHC